MSSAEPWNIPNTKLGAGAVILKNDEVVLVKINHGPAAGKWILPGGRVETGESLIVALNREVKEETGLSVIVDGLLACRQRVNADSVMDVYFLFRCQIDPNSLHEKLQPVDPEEIIDIRYWNISEALSSEEVRPVTQEAIRLATSGKPLFKLRESPPGFLAGDYFFS